MPLLAYDTVKSARPPMEIWQNGSPSAYWAGENPLINPIKLGVISGSSGTGSRINGYPDVSAGGTYTILVHSPSPKNFDGDPWEVWDYLYTGVWTLRWNGTADAIWRFKRGTIGTPTDVSGSDPDYDNAWEYNITDPTAGGNANGQETEVVVTGDGTMSDLHLVTPGDKTRYNNGERFCQKWLDENAGIKYYRTMESQKTNNSPIRHYTEFRDPDALNWPVGRGMPLEYVYKAAHELGAYLWYQVPALATTACITSIVQELTGYMTPNEKANAIWENSNEYWNSAAGFGSGFRAMFEMENINAGDIWEIDDANIDRSTGIFTQVGHGLTDHKLIYGYEAVKTSQNTKTWYRYGTDLYAIYLTDDTFQLCRRFERGFIDDIIPNGTTSTYIDLHMLKSNGDPDTQHYYRAVGSLSHAYVNSANHVKIIGSGVSQLDGNTYDILSSVNSTRIEIDVDSSTFDAYDPADGGNTLAPQNVSGVWPPTNRLETQFGWPGAIPDDLGGEFNFFRYTKAGSTKSNHENYVDRTRQIWGIVEAEVGAGNLVKILAGQGNSVATCIGQLEYDPDIWSEIDYYAIGAYFQTKPTDYENKTPTEMTDAADYNRRIAKKAPMLSVERHYGAMGSFKKPIIIYEGGDHNGGFTATADQIRALVTWARDPEATRAYTEYAQNHANFNVAALCHFKTADYPDTEVADGFQGTFSCTFYTGATDPDDRRQYDGIQPYYANGIRPV